MSANLRVHTASRRCLPARPLTLAAFAAFAALAPSRSAIAQSAVPGPELASVGGARLAILEPRLLPPPPAPSAPADTDAPDAPELENGPAEQAAPPVVPSIAPEPPTSAFADPQPMPLPHSDVQAPSAAPRAATHDRSGRKPLVGGRTASNWILSLSGVTRAPIDMSGELGVETPFGLRLAGSYGYVPVQYLSVITGAMVGANAIDDDARSLIQSGFESGRSFRLQAGIRPFRRLGLYADGGYSQLRLSGTMDASELISTSDALGDAKFHSRIDAWFVELGWQGMVANRVLLAFGMGVMRVGAAKTTADVSYEAIDARAATEDVLRDVDHVVEKYGVMPTLSLRLGFDMI